MTLVVKNRLLFLTWLWLWPDIVTREHILSRFPHDLPDSIYFKIFAFTITFCDYKFEKSSPKISMQSKMNCSKKKEQQKSTEKNHTHI